MTDSSTNEPRRSAVITGGGTGLGFATAAALHAEGWHLTLVGRRADVLESAATRLAGPAGTIATAVADLAEPDAPAEVVAAHVARFGGIDALVASAGSYELVDTREMTASAWDSTMDTQLRGAVLCAAAAARPMVAAGSGRIVLLSSVNGLHSEPASLAYSAAKAAIISVARTLAVDLAGTGVTANAVAPGWVITPMTEAYLATTSPEQLQRVNPLGRAGRPEEIAAVIRFLIVDAPEFLTGATITVDGGQTAMAPMP
ncbi:MAG TPA: SDR family oxidoreductase [Jatrophihabitans sp.]|jgi:NAD(P)-dependent dehydrogenase (short-subunit alcohol dehydrogenase family)|uniref:SDR family NAD(P)-dependent oxidoreductase n=1 Tax=Jatrophihabitans sp. TaxID=1932789 RepID=UPI002E0ADDAD|nr:SDR family oxidoreductase [Jatrophihabitans sp.]